MNANDPRHPWSRLTAAARQVPMERDVAPPYGFAVRVAALALAPDRRLGSLLERLAPRAVGIASLLALLSVVANYPAFESPAQDESVAAEEPVLLLLDQ